MAFPRLNNISSRILPLSLILFLFAAICWTLYPVLPDIPSNPRLNAYLAIFALPLSGISSLLRPTFYIVLAIVCLFFSWELGQKEFLKLIKCSVIFKTGLYGITWILTFFGLSAAIVNGSFILLILFFLTYAAVKSEDKYLFAVKLGKRLFILCVLWWVFYKIW
jgi:heme/copper-type cytochrome/quinol oxidase subunit 1